MMLNKISVPAVGVLNQGLGNELNERRLLYTKKNTPRDVLLKSCHKQLKEVLVIVTVTCLLVRIWGLIN